MRGLIFPRDSAIVREPRHCKLCEGEKKQFSARAND